MNRLGRCNGCKINKRAEFELELYLNKYKKDNIKKELIFQIKLCYNECVFVEDN